MKSSTLVILCAALAFSAPSIATAQSTTVDTNVGAEVTVDGNGVGVNAGAEGSATTDGNATTDGDADAAAAGGTNAMDESMQCNELGTSASIEAMGMTDMSALSAATNVAIVTVADCDDTTRSALAGAGGTALRDALMGNAAVDAAIKARGADDSDVLGATVSGDTITVYIESDVDG